MTPSSWRCWRPHIKPPRPLPPVRRSRALPGHSCSAPVLSLPFLLAHVDLWGAVSLRSQKMRHHPRHLYYRLPLARGHGQSWLRPSQPPSPHQALRLPCCYPEGLRGTSWGLQRLELRELGEGLVLVAVCCRWFSTCPCGNSVWSGPSLPVQSSGTQLGWESPGVKREQVGAGPIPLGQS